VIGHGKKLSLKTRGHIEAVVQRRNVSQTLVINEITDEKILLLAEGMVNLQLKTIVIVGSAIDIQVFKGEGARGAAG